MTLSYKIQCTVCLEFLGGTLRAVVEMLTPAVVVVAFIAAQSAPSALPPAASLPSSLARSPRRPRNDARDTTSCAAPANDPASRTALLMRRLARYQRRGPRRGHAHRIPLLAVRGSAPRLTTPFPVSNQLGNRLNEKGHSWYGKTTCCQEHDFWKNPCPEDLMRRNESWAYCPKRESYIEVARYTRERCG